ncbi:Gfo/Idh/MocA family oxidoreductase [bacterium]|nr:Gfo/Idh/MocA family oxidoreductase [bacterium]
MSGKLKIGMVGAGFIGQLAHLMNYVEIEDCQVTALAEFRPELRRRVAGRFGIPHTYAGHLDLLSDGRVDAVVVVTPRPYLAPIVLDCIAAGKPVLSEKPMAGTAAQGGRLVAAAREKGVHYSVGYMRRHDEGVQAAKKILDEFLSSGSVGPVIYARAHCFRGESYCNLDGHVVTDEKTDYPDSGWPMFPEWLPEKWRDAYTDHVNTYSHTLNLLRYLLGRTPRIEHVHVTRQNARVALLDFGEFSAAFETGRGSSREWDEVIEIFFEAGRLTIKTPPALLRNVPATVEVYRAGLVQEVIRPQVSWSWSFRRQAEAFVKDVREGRDAISSGDDALEDLRLFEEMWRRNLGL